MKTWMPKEFGLYLGDAVRKLNEARRSVQDAMDTIDSFENKEQQDMYTHLGMSVRDVLCEMSIELNNIIWG